MAPHCLGKTSIICANTFSNTFTFYLKSGFLFKQFFQIRFTSVNVFHLFFVQPHAATRNGSQTFRTSALVLLVSPFMTLWATRPWMYTIVIIQTWWHGFKLGRQLGYISFLHLNVIENAIQMFIYGSWILILLNPQINVFQCYCIECARGVTVVMRKINLLAAVILCQQFAILGNLWQSTVPCYEVTVSC